MADNRRPNSNRGRDGRSGGPRRSDGRGGNRRSDGGRGSSDRRSGGRGRDDRNRDDGRRDDRPRDERGRGDAPRSAKKEITAGTGQLPRWVRDEVIHSTPKVRREVALAELESGVSAYAEERYGKAAGALGRAKELSPRAATIRELLGLSLYQLERWQEALAELRTYRRLTGTTDHMAIEIDCQRALGRVDGADKTWELFNELGGSNEAGDEVRVVYASSLLERGEKTRAWLVIKPERLIAHPSPSMLRRWAVAARVADANGDRETARKLIVAIRDADPDLPWLSQYDDLLA